MDKLLHLARDESGVTAIEYALIGGAVALVIFAAMPGMKGPLATFFKSLNDGFDAVAPQAASGP